MSWGQPERAGSLRAPKSISNGSTGDGRLRTAATSAVPIANAEETPAVTQAGKPWPLHAQPGGPEPRVAPSAPGVHLANSVPSSPSLLLCPRYLEKWKENILSLQHRINLQCTPPTPQMLLELQRKQLERVLYRLLLGWVSFARVWDESQPSRRVTRAATRAAVSFSPAALAAGQAG